MTEKFYIGMHSTFNLHDEYLGSGYILKRSIKKYGSENHKKEILEFFDDRESLAQREAEVVNEELLKNQNCLNLTIGGKGGFSSKQQKENNIKSQKRRKFLRENDIAWKEKWLQNASIGHKKSYEEGRREKKYFYNWTGKTHSEETKNLQRIVKKGQGKGKENSQYGTMWITNKEGNKKIKKEEFEQYKINGWIAGRKITYGI